MSERLLRIADVTRKTGLGRSTIYRRISRGEFPGAFDLGGGAVAWKESDIERWIGQLTCAAGQATSPAAEARR